LTLILIRARDLAEAVEIYRSIFSFRMVDNIAGLFGRNPDATSALPHIAPMQLGFDFVLLAVLIIGDLSARSKTFGFFELPRLVRAAYYAACVLLIFYQATSMHPLKPFLYFQF
jgi:hypothetical protein